MTITTLLTAALAAWEAVEVWRHSSLFSTARARVELWRNLAGELLMCPFCLSPWVSLVTVLWLGLADALLDETRHPALRLLAQAPVHALAVARLANLANDATRGVNRTPKADRLPDHAEATTPAGDDGPINDGF